ncbi:MAG: hypothetical protein R2688_06600 [Fimbriimonadaceae bacterium]
MQSKASGRANECQGRHNQKLVQEHILIKRVDSTAPTKENKYCQDHVNLLKTVLEKRGKPYSFTHTWYLSALHSVIEQMKETATEREKFLDQKGNQENYTFTDHLKEKGEYIEREYTWATEDHVLDFAEELPPKLNAKMRLSEAAQLLNTSTEQFRELLESKQIQRYRSGFCSQELIEYGKNMGGRFISYRSVYTEVAQEDWQMYPSGEIFGERIVIDGQVVRDTYSECFPDVYSCAYPEDPKFREWEKVMMGTDLYTFLSDREIRL